MKFDICRVLSEKNPRGVFFFRFPTEAPTSNWRESYGKTSIFDGKCNETTKLSDLLNFCSIVC